MRMLILVVLFLSGCAQIETRISWQHDRSGALVQVLEIKGAACPPEFYNVPNKGCALREPMRIVFYANEQARQHELDHIAGMEHGPWYEHGTGKCTQVIYQGRSTHEKGEIICIDQLLMDEN